MFRRFFTYFTFILFFTVGLFVFYKFYGVVSTKKVDLLSYTPDKANFVIRFNKINEKIKILNPNSLIWKYAIEEGFFMHINYFLYHADSLSSSYPQLKKSIDSDEMIFSMHMGNNVSGNWFFATQGHLTEELMTELLPKFNINVISNRDYKGQAIYKLAFKNNIFYISVNQEVLLLSASESLIENAFAKNKSVNNLTKLNNDAFANVMIYNAEYDISNIIVKNINSNFVFPPISESNFDVYLEANTIRLNGYREYYDKPILQEQEFSLKNYIIENCEWYYTFSLSDANSYFRQRINGLKNSKYTENALQWLENFNSRYGCDIEKDFMSWIDSEVLLIKPNNSDSSSKLILFKTSTYQTALQELNKLSIKTDTNITSPYTYSSLEINKIHLPELFQMFFGELFQMPEYVYYTILDDVILFSSSLNTAKEYLSDIINEKYLYRNMYFDKLYSENYADKISSMFYMNEDKSKDILNQITIKPNLFSSKLFNYISSVSWQTNAIKNNKELCQAIFSFTFAENNIVKQGNLWVYNLQSNMINRPFSIYNHTTKTTSILVQDEDYVLYMINNAGELVWKKQLEDKILGNISKIDMFGNGKLQLCFATSNALHVIDFEGNYIQPFPFHPDKDITGPISVFDYENNGQYRFMIPVQSKLINIDKTAKHTQGWSFETTGQIINQEPLFFRVNAKDYIVCNDASGKLYVLDRKGHTRYENKTNALNRSKEKFIYEKAASIEGCSFIYSDTSGNLMRMYFNGKTDVLYKHSYHHKYCRIINKNDYIIVADSGRVYIHKAKQLNKSSLIFDGEIPLEVNTNDRNDFDIIVITNFKAYLISSTLKFLHQVTIQSGTSAIIDDINKDGVMEIIYSPGDRQLITKSYK